MELKFSNNLDSIKRLDEIMNSYPGRNQGSIMAHELSMEAMLSLLEQGKIVVTEYAYPYDRDIRDDKEMMEIYSELAMKTRWKQFGYTEIEGIRINAIRQMRHEGEPDYDGDFICYKEGRICVHCGNLTLHQLLMYIVCHEQMEQLYVFTYPYWTEDQTARCYRFDLSEAAVADTVRYRGSVWEILRAASEAGGVVHKIPQPEGESLS